jgi:hypothetical protein
MQDVSRSTPSSGRGGNAVNETQRRFLRRLRDAQPYGLRRSAIPTGCKNLVESLRTCGAAEFSRASSGRGVVLRIVSDEAFERFVIGRLPQGLDIDMTTVSDHAQAVVMLADAKAIRRAVGQGILVRSAKSNVTIESTDGQGSIPVSEMSTVDRAVVIRLSSDKMWTFEGTIAVVEGAYAFWRYERLIPQADLAVLGSGNMSAALLNWLASPAMARCHIIHWGDYDPVGVWQYLRLAEACPGRVESFAPPEIDELIRRSKRALVTRQGRYLDRLRSRSCDSYVRRMTDLFDRYRRGLEHEALLYGERAETA